jgi:hypothetical protein
MTKGVKDSGNKIEERARARAAKRAVQPTKWKKSAGKTSTKFEMTTGSVTVTEGKGLGNFVMSNNNDHPGTTNPGGTYESLFSVAHHDTLLHSLALSRVRTSSKKHSSNAQVVRAKAKMEVTDPSQKRILAVLEGIGVSEHQRSPVGGKTFRAGVDAAANDMQKNPTLTGAARGASAARAAFKAAPQLSPSTMKFQSQLPGESGKTFRGGASSMEGRTKAGNASKNSMRARHTAGAEFSDSSDDD